MLLTSLSTALKNHPKTAENNSLAKCHEQKSRMGSWMNEKPSQDLRTHQQRCALHHHLMCMSRLKRTQKRTDLSNNNMFSKHEQRTYHETKRQCHIEVQKCWERTTVCNVTHAVPLSCCWAKAKVWKANLIRARDERLVIKKK